MRIAVLLVILVAVVGLVVLGVLIGVVAARNARAARVQRNAPRLRAEATVVDKRSEITGGGDARARQHYFVTFQFPAGNRVELKVTGPESGMLSPGDTGTVEWQGSRYLGFEREILR